MKRHMCARGLVVGAMSVLALAASAGVAQADADPFTPSIPGIIDQIVTETPDLFPSEHLLRLRAAAEAKFADKLAGIPRG